MMSEDEMIAKAKRAYKMGKLRNQKSRVDARRHHLLKLSKRRKVHVPEPFISAEELVRLYPDQFKAMPGSRGNKALFVGDTADDIVTLMAVTPICQQIIRSQYGSCMLIE